MIELSTSSPGQTQLVGELLAPYLAAGTLVGFTGALGAGKTCFIQGLCRGLGVRQNVTSPTFVIMHRYEGRAPVYHFDLYRLDEPSQLFDLDYETYFWGDGIALVEWVERAGGLLSPGDFIEVELSFGVDEDGRAIRVSRLPGEKEFAEDVAARCTR